MTEHEERSAALITVARSDVTLDHLAALLEANHGLSAYCPACRRWAELDLQRLVADGYGARRLQGFRPRCTRCGGLGKVQVRPPTPSWGGANWGVIR